MADFDDCAVEEWERRAQEERDRRRDCGWCVERNIQRGCTLDGGVCPLEIAFGDMMGGCHDSRS